ncbi:hypothetical protein EMCRGX_G002685, partial [Ephydatia muelleri]
HLITSTPHHLHTSSPPHLITSSPHHLTPHHIHTSSPHHLITSSPHHLITSSSRSDLLYRCVQWVWEVWHLYNYLIGQLELPDLVAGPKHFFSCPVEAADP